MLALAAALWAFQARAQDTQYLLDLDPDAVDEQQLYEHAALLERNYQAYHSAQGISWEALYAEAGDAAPSLYGTGGDSAIFTGFYLAAAIYRFVTTGGRQDLDAVLGAARGLHLLTHVSGTPGVIARCAFPADQAGRWRYPESWQERIDRGFVYESPADIPDIGAPGAFYPPMIFYTRATRDQLTGILYGVGVGLAELDPAAYTGQISADVGRALGILQEVIRAVWRRLRATGFIIRDHRGATGTTACLVDGLLKAQLLAVYRAALGQREKPGSLPYRRADRLYRLAFAGAFGLNDGDLGDIFNRNSLLDGYFSFNLRFARSFTVHRLESDGARLATVTDYMTKHVWRYVRDHRNTHFNFLYAAATGDGAGLADARRSLRELALKPLRSWSSPLIGQDRYPPRRVLLRGDTGSYVVPVHLRKPTGYFIWQKDPFATGAGEADTQGLTEATGLDFMLPYWMGRRYGFIDPPGPSE